MRDDKNMGVEEEICKALFGDAVDPREFFAKSNPDQSTLHVPGALKKPRMSKDRKQRAVTAGLSSIGAAAGAAGLGVVARDVKRAGSFKATPRSTKVLLPLEVAGLGGELMATKILHHDAVKKPKNVLRKNDFEPILNARRLGVINTERALEMIEKAGLPKPLAQISSQLKKVTAGVKQEKAAKTYSSNIIQSGINSVGTPTLRKLGYTGAAGAGVAAGVGGHKLISNRSKNTPQTKMPKATPSALPPVNVNVSAVKVKKNASITWAGEISKVNEDKHQVFGWATVTEVDGVPVVDRQNDMVSLEEIEKAAYEYVITSRKGGDMHARDGSQPLHTSDLIESFLVTDEKLSELGVDPAAVSKRGWWMGFHIKDEQQWELVKKGGRTGFSIHGKGLRTERDSD